MWMNQTFALTPCRRSRVVGISGCGTSATLRPGNSSVDANVPSRNARSTVSATSRILRVHFLPLVDVRNGQDRRRGTVDAVAHHRVRCPRHGAAPEKSRDTDAAVESATARSYEEFDCTAMLPIDTSWLHGPFACRNAVIRARRVHRDAVRVGRFTPQVMEPRVVPDVRVRQKDAVRQGAPCGQALHLGRKIRRRIEDVGAPVGERLTRPRLDTFSMRRRPSRASQAKRSDRMPAAGARRLARCQARRAPIDPGAGRAGPAGGASLRGVDLTRRPGRRARFDSGERAARARHRILRLGFGGGIGQQNLR